MNKTVLTPEQKAKKAAYDKAYRERKKATAQSTVEAVEAEVAEKAPKAEKAPRAKKERVSKKKVVAPEFLEMVQPLRNILEQLTSNRSTEEMTFIQNELRRMSRTVKKAKVATV